MKVPNAENAVVDIRKLKDYCLDPEHPRGKHKAKVFQSVLGFTKTYAAELKNELEMRIKTEECIKAESDEFGDRYIIDFHYCANQKEAMIRSSWIIRKGEGFPRLTSCYIL